MPFYRRRWTESRGDEHDDWGGAVYYFWVWNGVLEQQVGVYDSRIVLVYDRNHVEDEFGCISQVPLDADEWSPFEIASMLTSEKSAATRTTGGREPRLSDVLGAA
jgi:hypothetical protein